MTEEIGLTPEGLSLCRRDPLLLADSAKGVKSGHLDYLQRIIQKGGLPALMEKPRIHLTTVHGSKGMEWDHVFVSQDALPNSQDGLAEDPETERRLKYVALTRAKQTCTILPEMAEGGWSI